MSSTAAPFAAPPTARARPLLVAALLALAAAGWALLDRIEPPMGSEGRALAALAVHTGAWVLMIAAMMFPSAAPMVAMYHRMSTARRAGGARSPRGTTAAFVLGYVAGWALAGVLAFGVLRAGATVGGEALAWHETARFAAGGVLLAAALYELTPLKDACLTRCRSPFSFLVTRWREGRAGALRMGAGHGLWCVGCCWGLMAALLALGAMSIGWMAFVAALIAAEKLSPRPVAASRAVAGALALLGLLVLLAPEALPGLPSGAHAMPAMR